MTDLVLSLPPTVVPKFRPVDRLCTHNLCLWAPKLSGLSYGNLCTIQFHNRASRISTLTQAGITRVKTVTTVLDPELRMVLELASDAELSELSDILYGRSILSPLLKSVTYRDGPHDEILHTDDQDGREALMERLESRFLFLAADAKATLSGRRPSYHNVLLQVRKKLNVPCSMKLSTEDMEAEIFLHLLQEYSSKPKHSMQFSWKSRKSSFVNSIENRQQGSGQWRGYILAAVKLGAEELLSVVLKGGTAVTISKLQHVVAKKLLGRMLLETAKYQLARDVMRKGGQAVAAKLESHVALLAARQGFAGAASRYVALRSTMMLLGPFFQGKMGS
eukprot:Gb_14792 [translate_table: standard]